MENEQLGTCGSNLGLDGPGKEERELMMKKLQEGAWGHAITLRGERSVAGGIVVNPRELPRAHEMLESAIVRRLSRFADQRERLREYLLSAFEAAVLRFLRTADDDNPSSPHWELQLRELVESKAFYLVAKRAMIEEMRKRRKPATWRIFACIVPERYHEGVLDPVLGDLYDDYRTAVRARRHRTSRALTRVAFTIRAWVATFSVLRAITVDRLINGPMDIPEEEDQIELEARGRLAADG